jgi:hypothetical protein
MRVYLPATIPLLARLSRERELTLPEGCAVTKSLREWYAEGDEEELEYAALTAAARASLRLLTGNPEVPRRRVVIAADVPDGAVAELAGAESDESAEPGVIKVTEAVRLADIAALHIDEAAAEQAVTAAVAALAAAGTGDAALALAMEAVEDFELLWYVTQELGYLL